MNAPLADLAACLRGAPPGGMDWDRVIRLANVHFLGPRLYRALAAAPGAGKRDDEAMEYLAGLDAANRERNARLLAQLAELAAALAAEGIRPLAIKGAAELVRHAPAGGTARMLRDLDLLLPPEAALRTEAVLRALGYARFPGDPGAHSLGGFYRGRDVGSVDIHLRLPRLFAHLLSPAELAERSVTLPFAGTGLCLPDASLHYVINLGHEMLHDEAAVSGLVELRYLVELADLARDSARPLDRGWILGKAGCWKFRLGLELQARMARQLGLGALPAPPETPLGALLHRRRLFKIAHPGLGAVEWQVLRRAKRLRHLPARRPAPAGAAPAA